MSFFRSMIGGIIGGAIGAAIWTTISYVTHFEVVGVAWFVGILVGLGVRLGADDWDGVGPGGLALLISLAAVLGGKYIASEIVMPNRMNLAPTAVDVKRNMARMLINEYTAKRVQLDWPKGNRRNQIQSQLDRDIYPESVVSEVDKRWNEMTEQQKNEVIEKEKERLKEVMKNFKDDTRQNFIRNNFRIIDYIFFGLAAITAWRIGAGGFKRRFT